MSGYIVVVRSRRYTGSANRNSAFASRFSKVLAHFENEEVELAEIK